MTNKFAVKIICSLISFGIASAQAAPATLGETPNLTTISKQKEAPKNDPIYSTMAKLAIQLAAQTEYTYVDGKIQSETRPDGVVGTYLYDRNGRLQGISYSDGRALTAIYDKNDRLESMLENGTGQRFVYGKKSGIPNAKDPGIGSAFDVQKGISALIDRQKSWSGDPVCRDGSEEPCIVNAPGGGGGGGWSGGGPRRIPTGGGGGGGSKGGGKPPKSFSEWSQDPYSCVIKLCVPSAVQMDWLCTFTRNPGKDIQRCRDEATAFYNKCAESCFTNDWRWIDDMGKDGP